MSAGSAPAGIRVFICHASEDKPLVRELCRKLSESGFAPWLDEQELLPGQDWDEHIDIALRSSQAVLVCLSPSSVAKAGYVQKEVRRILDIAEEQPEGVTFLIPVKLEPCSIPRRLARFHCADLSETNGFDRLLTGLREHGMTKARSPEIRGVETSAEAGSTTGRPSVSGRRRRSYAAIVVMGAVVGLLGAGVYLRRRVEAPIVHPPPKPPTITDYPALPSPAEEVEVLLDRSDEMHRPFFGGVQGGTTLMAATEAVKNVIRGLDDSTMLALRLFGGDCQGIEGDSSLAVPFRQNNEARLRIYLDALKSGGKASLSHAVIKAMSDFESVDFPKARKRIVVITGPPNSCSNDAADVIGTIRKQVKESGSRIHLDFHFIGIGALTAAEKAQIKEVAKATQGEDPVFVERRQDLENELKRIVIGAPMAYDAKKLVDALDAGVGHLNVVLRDIGNNDFTSAETALKRAGGDSRNSDMRFDELGKGQRKDQFRRLYEAAALNRGLQNRLLLLTATMLSQAKANNIEAYNDSAKQYEKLSSEYNRNNKLIASLLKQQQ